MVETSRSVGLARNFIAGQIESRFPGRDNVFLRLVRVAHVGLVQVLHDSRYLLIGRRRRSPFETEHVEQSLLEFDDNCLLVFPSVFVIFGGLPYQVFPADVG